METGSTGFQNAKKYRLGGQIMKVQNMISSSGRAVPNQFILTDDRDTRYFQSYESIIAKIPVNSKFSSDKMYYELIELDEKYWNYSKTTSRYRNQFLGETTKETQAKIDSGEYVLSDLN